MNPIIATLSGGNNLPGNLAQIKGIMNMVKAAQNPTAMMNQMLQNNPNYNTVMQLINQHNGDAKAAFFDLAKQKGVDPNEILNALK